MTNRPTTPSALGGCGGCFLIVFFSIFAWFGAMAFGTALSGKAALSVLPPLAFGLLFLTIGLGGMYAGVRTMSAALQRHRPLQLPGYKHGHAGTSAQAAPLEYKLSSWFPKLPNRRQVNGMTQLRPSPGLGSSFWGLLIFGMLWNGLTYGALLGIYHQGDLSIGLAIFIGLFAIIGALILWGAARAFLQIIMIGKMTVALSSEPLLIGGSSSLLLRQPGSFTAARLKIALICREEATHGSGSDRATEKHEVLNQVLLERQNLQARNNSPMAQIELRIPADAMHSFSFGNNALVWGVQVQMTIKGRPDVDLFFPFRVSPVIAPHQRGGMQ